MINLDGLQVFYLKKQGFYQYTFFRIFYKVINSLYLFLLLFKLICVKNYANNKSTCSQRQRSSKKKKQRFTQKNAEVTQTNDKITDECPLNTTMNRSMINSQMILNDQAGLLSYSGEHEIEKCKFEMGKKLQTQLAYHGVEVCQEAQD